MSKLVTAIIAALAGVAGLSVVQGGAVAEERETTMLRLESKIPLGNVSGRIDHMAVDLARRRVFVAELGANSVGIVDLDGRRVLHAITGLKEPQGVAFVPSVDTLYVANGGDGSVRLYRGPDYVAAGQIGLGDDADNIRVDRDANRMFVGYGSGGLAVIDLAESKKVADIPLEVHPEGFQLDPDGSRIFVNLPRARAIAVIDRGSGKQVGKWRMDLGRDNFPMAFDQAARQVIVAFRNPAKLGVFSSEGALIASPDICGDADDVFVDQKRRRVYVSCGEGALDVLDAERNAYQRIARIPTLAGARTSLFVPEIDRLLLAARASSGEPAGIWVYRPDP
jgi:DNA-binding beta-propeller fold protein YncE